MSGKYIYRDINGKTIENTAKKIVREREDK